MNDVTAAIRMQLSRQIAHWTVAVSRLENLDDLASPAAWNGLERYLGLSIRQHLMRVIERLKHQTVLLRAALNSASNRKEIESVRRLLLAFRRQYLRAETTLYFFADAINTRTNPTIAGLLRACDSMAQRSMAQILDQIGKPAPVVLTYLDKGLGASILKAGLRLWDGTGENPVAVVKITMHNLHRPTSLIHETGHQMAHISGWNEELALVLRRELQGAPADLGEIWAGWTTEIAADAFAFVHTGYASVAALHDVLAGDEAAVFRHLPGDPHPTGYIRVLLNVEMCRQFYGAGPWDDLALAWTEEYPLDKAGVVMEELLRASIPLLPSIVNAILRRPMRSFGGRPLSALIDPMRVSPGALEEMENRLGLALYTSMHWIWTESLRLLALNGLRISIMPDKAPELLKQQVAWMSRLGGTLQVA